MQAMSSKHDEENIILRGLHKKKELGDGSEKTWLVMAKEEVRRTALCSLLLWSALCWDGSQQSIN